VTCTGKRRTDGSQTDNALTIKPHHLMGARHVYMCNLFIKLANGHLAHGIDALVLWADT